MERKISLYYSDLAVGGRSNKEYHVQITKAPGGCAVNFQFGPRGGTLQTGTKTPSPVSFQEATAIFDRLVAEKMGKGYKPEGEYACAGPLITPKVAASRTPYQVELLEEITEAEARAYIENREYWMQVKVDGHRRQIEKTADGITSYNRKGEAVPVPSDIAKELLALPVKSFLMDGELVGNNFVAFDLLNVNGIPKITLEYRYRFAELEKLLVPSKKFICVVPTWQTKREKIQGMESLRADRFEGAVFKLAGAQYRAGRNGQHKKLKFVKSVSCKVIAVRVESKDNAAIALLDGARWTEVAHVSTIGKGNIHVGDIVEVKFLYATEGRRLYQPRIDCVRTDIRDADCTMAQLAKAFKQGVAA